MSPPPPTTTSVHVLHGIRSNANSLRAILPPPIPPHRVSRLWRHNFRFVLLTVGFLLCTSLSINAGLFNFTVICMDSAAVVNEGGGEQRGEDIGWNEDGRYIRAAEEGGGHQQQQQQMELSPIPTTQIVPSSNKWHSVAFFTKSERDKLMWAMAFGTLVSVLPLVHLYSLFGARHVLFYAALLSAVSTALGPLAASIGFWPFAIVRLMQGIAYAADFSALGMLCARWAALDEHGLFLALVSSYTPASVTLGNTLSALMCSSALGWPAVYYLSAGLCVVFASLWFALYRDQPQMCCNCSTRELQHIQVGKTPAHVEMMAPLGGKAAVVVVPYMEILCSGLVWACWLNAFVELVSGVFIVQYKPQYFNYVLGYSVLDTGWLTALPSALHIPLKIAIGLASDRIKFCSERHKLVFFNCISVGLPAFGYLGIAFASNATTAFWCFLSISLFYSAAGASFYKCAMLTSRQYGHFVMAGCQLNKCLALFISPALVSLLVHNPRAQHEWARIFVLFAGACLAANGIFCLVATDQPVPFTGKRKVTTDSDNGGTSGSSKQQQQMKRNSKCKFYIG